MEMSKPLVEPSVSPEYRRLRSTRIFLPTQVGTAPISESLIKARLSALTSPTAVSAPDRPARAPQSDMGRSWDLSATKANLQRGLQDYYSQLESRAMSRMASSAGSGEKIWSPVHPRNADDLVAGCYGIEEIA